MDVYRNDAEDASHDPRAARDGEDDLGAGLGKDGDVGQVERGETLLHLQRKLLDVQRGKGAFREARVVENGIDYGHCIPPTLALMLRSGVRPEVSRKSRRRLLVVAPVRRR